MRDTVVGLDLVRVAAAILVMCFHLTFWAWASPASHVGMVAGDLPPLTQPFVEFGWIGVQIFFVLSGLLIARSANGQSAFAFMRARVVRLFPAVWICGGTSAAVLLAIGLERPSDLARAFGRTIFLVPIGPWVDTVYWTLAVELMFYALVGTLLLLNLFKHAPRMFDILACTSAIYWTISLAKPDATSGWAWPLAGLLLLRHGCFFSLGGMLWLASVRGLSVGLLLRMAATIPVCIIEIHSVSQTVALHTGRVSALVPIALWTLTMVGIIASLRCSRWGFTSRATTQARATALMTFPLYLLHGVIGGAVLRTGLLPGKALMLAALAICIALAFLVSALLEPRLQQLFRVALDRIDRALRPCLPFLFRCTAPVPGTGERGDANHPIAD